MSATQIIRAALEARTPAQAQKVQDLITADVGARHQRWVGDRSQTSGLIGTAGNKEHKVLELVTNAQDAVLERFALKRFGSYAKVPYDTPRQAAEALLGTFRRQEIAQMVQIELHEAGEDPRTAKRITPIVKDAGCGMENHFLARSLLRLGSAHKRKALWQQGAFGLGGASTFRHAEAIVIVTRPHPDVAADDDRVTVAVCQWEEHEKGKGLYYLVTSEWDEDENRNARPWSAAASDFSEFEGGTHIALISYEIDTFQYVTHGAEKSLERVINTRLYEPVTPVLLVNRIPKNEAERSFLGLKRQLEENPRKERREIHEALPFRINGETAHLPVTCHYFESGKRDDPGAKRTVVAHDHAVIFTSNGQVHRHWSPQKLRFRTDLKHISDRVLVVVDLDELPIKLRTNLFQADRSDFIDNEQARRIEADLISLLNDPEGELYDLDREILRQAIRGEGDSRPTINIARQIGRALKFKGGFAFAGAGRRNGGKKRQHKRAKPDLYADPTTIEGPGQIDLQQGQTRAIRFHLNARNEFLNSGRGQLDIVCDHPDIGPQEVTIGELRDGSVRATIAMAEQAQLGDFTLTAAVRGWARSSGGIGPDLEWKTKVKVIEPRKVGEPKKRSNRGSQDDAEPEGELVGLKWKSEDTFDHWHSGVPGHVEEIEAKELAEDEDYKDLAKLGGTKVPTIFLNQDYTPLKRYESARGKDLTPKGIREARDRYAVGAGLGLLLLDRDLKKAKSNGGPLPEEAELTAKQAAAQSALVMMPQYDRLAQEAGVED